MNIKEASIIAEQIYKNKEDYKNKNQFEILIDKILYNLLNNKETEPIEFIMNNKKTILIDCSKINPLRYKDIQNIL